jgi:cell division protein FtsL
MAVIGARPAGGLRLLPRRPRVRPRQGVRPTRRPGADRRRREVTSVSGLLVAIAAAVALALFYLSQSSHVAATGYEIDSLQAQVAELRAEQQQLILQIGEAQSPSVIQQRAADWLHLQPIPQKNVTFAPTSTDPPF